MIDAERLVIIGGDPDMMSHSDITGEIAQTTLIYNVNTWEVIEGPGLPFGGADPEQIQVIIAGLKHPMP